MHRDKKEEIKNSFRQMVTEVIKEYRRKIGLTQEQMARKLHMAVRSYIDLEHGLTAPSAITLSYFLLLMEKEEREMFLADIKQTIDKE